MLPNRYYISAYTDQLEEKSAKAMQCIHTQLVSTTVYLAKQLRAYAPWKGVASGLSVILILSGPERSSVIYRELGGCPLLGGS